MGRGVFKDLYLYLFTLNKISYYTVVCYREDTERDTSATMLFYVMYQPWNR